MRRDGRRVYTSAVNPALKALLVTAIGGLLLSLVSLLIWLSVNGRHLDGFVFGHVVSVGTGSIAIADREDRRTDVLIGTGTVITDKGGTLAPEDIPVGQFVQVTGKRVEPHVIRADAIRFMRAPGPGPDPAPPHAPRP